MNRGILCLTALLAFAATTTAQIQIRQGTTQAAIDPLTSAPSVVAFYAYGTVDQASAATGLETSDTSLLFFYKENIGPLSLVFIHDLPSDLGGGQVRFDISGLPTGTFYTVKDDQPSQRPGGGGDKYTPDPPVAGVTVAEWKWVDCCTDGAAISGLDSGPFCVAIEPSFFTGITTWQFLSGPAATPTDLPNIVDTTYLCDDCHELTCPGDPIAECTGARSAFVGLQATGQSLCAGETLTNDRNGGGADASDSYPVGTTPVLFTLTDTPGFESTCTNQVLVEDTIPPDLIVPQAIVLECNEPGGIDVNDPQIQTWLAQATATDICGGVTLTDDSPAFFPSGCGPGVTTTVTFEAIDEEGLKTTLTATVTVKDTTAPTLNVPAPLKLECSSKGGVPATDPRIQSWLQSATGSDICGGATITNDAPALFPSGCGAGTTTTVTFTAVDDCGNLTELKTTVTVVDTTPSAIIVPPPLTLECDATGGIPGDDPRIIAWLALASADDLCGDSKLANDAPKLFPAGCIPGQETIVTFTAVDECGNTAEETSTVTVVDTTPPEVSDVGFDGLCLWPPNHKYYCIDDVAGAIVALDTCDPNPPVVTVVGCSSNQPDNGLGDGYTFDDCVVINAGAGVCVRSERSGLDPGGRFYAVTIEVADSCANAVTVDGMIEVPHDQSPSRDCERPNRGKDL